MGKICSYALWNNKGGVGKSTITFHLATRYAELHPKTKVLVVDMCPQSNASMILFGGGEHGENIVLDLSATQPAAKTVTGYIASVLDGGSGAPLPTWSDFVVRAHDYNASVADNLFVLSGDGNLEPMAPLISDRASQVPLTAGSHPWAWVHLIIRRLLEDIAAGDDEWMFFIDTNPSFSIYTEIAISAVDRMIVPVNADDASRVATRAMFTLIHGAHPPHPIYGQYTYAAKADLQSIERPKVHLVVGNRLTQHAGPAAAFRAMSDATADELFGEYQTHPHRFSTRDNAPDNREAFRDEYSVPLRDFNTAGVVAAHLGRPLSLLNGATHMVYGQEVQVQQARIQDCRTAIDAIVGRL